MSGSIQTSYGKKPKGFKGGLANSNPTTTKNSVAAAVLGIGTFVKASATGAVDLTATTDIIDGVVLKSSMLDSTTVEAGSSITIAKKAPVFVYCETACVEGAQVFVRCVVGAGAEPVGNVRNDVDTAKAVGISATFAETLTAAGLVEVNLNL